MTIGLHLTVMHRLHVLFFKANSGEFGGFLTQIHLLHREHCMGKVKKSLPKVKVQKYCQQTVLSFYSLSTRE